MVAGVGSIDLALFVVAADDGWMPQTEEHLQILTYLGVAHAVVALTKIDLAEPREAEVIAAVRTQLAGSPFAAAPIVPTSVVTGRGLDDLKTTLADELARTPSPRDFGKPRLPVDRVFTLKGIGTVVTGTLTGGTLRRGQAVVVQPGGSSTRIRSVQSHNRDVEVSGPGTRTALNLPDIAVAGRGSSAPSDAGVRRGEVITLAELGRATDTLDVRLVKSARLAGAKTLAARPLKDGALVRIHHGSANFAARVLLLDARELAPGEQALAQLRFDAPVFAFVGDRFIVRDWAEQATLAGGTFLDADANRSRFRTAAQREFLSRRAEGSGDVAVFAASEVQRERVLRRSALLVKSVFSAAEVSTAVARLAQEGKIVCPGDLLADGAWWSGLRRRAVEAIRAEHKSHPEHVGLALNQLRAALADELPLVEAFDALIGELCADGFAQTGAAIKEASHRPALPPHLQASGARLRAALSAKPFEPPSRKELAPDALAQQALRFLRDTGEVIELSEEVVLLSDSFNRIKETIVKCIRERGPATVSDLRQLLNTTRRIMMPVLERLDRDGVTVRQGDKRTLRAPRV
jgi:selenocysteine-specific elongation factor